MCCLSLDYPSRSSVYPSPPSSVPCEADRWTEHCPSLPWASCWNSSVGGTTRRSDNPVRVKWGYLFPWLASCGDSVDCLGSNTVSHSSCLLLGTLSSQVSPWKQLLSVLSSGLGIVRGEPLLAPDATLFLVSPYSDHVSEKSLFKTLLVLHNLSVSLFSVGTLSDISMK